MLAIAFTFPAGRYHATPWGRHVNEADLAWPPDPWRISRAMIAVWHRKLDPTQYPRAVLDTLLSKLAAARAPSYRLPEIAIHSHSRHYMPGRGDKKTLIFDAFARVATDDPIVIAWPDLELGELELALLDTLLENLGFLGRAESWVEAARCHGQFQFNCVPSDVDFDTETGEITGEIVRLMAPQQVERYQDFRKAKLAAAGIVTDSNGRMPKLKQEQKRLLTTLPADWIDALGADTGELQAAGWSMPPCARTISYRRPVRALQATATAPHTRHADEQPKKARTTARFALYGKPLPRIEDAIRIGEALRRAVMGRAGDVLGSHQIPSELSGHYPDGDSRSGHAFWLPEDADGDGKVDHLLVYAPDGLSQQAARVLTSLRTVRRDDGEPLRVMLEGIGTASAFATLSKYTGTATTWRSVTPYLHPWHLKKNEWRDPQRHLAAIQNQLQREWTLRHGALAQIEAVCLLDFITLDRGGRHLSPMQFHRFRHRSAQAQPDRSGRMIEIRFSGPVEGPVALGFGCHFGLGLFRPLN